MSAKCGKCGTETGIPETFFSERKSFRRGTSTYCPDCWAKRQLTRHWRFLILDLAIGALGVALIIFFPDLGSGWLLTNLFLFNVFLVLTILPHELGHALVGRWLGFCIFKIYVGFGEALFTKRILGFDTEFRTFPVGGFTVMAPASKSNFRGRYFATVLAGPLVNLGLASGVLLFIPLSEIWNFADIDWRLIPGRLFFYSNLWILLFNLWPHQFKSPAGILHSDGKLLLGASFLGWETVSQRHALRFAMEGAAAHSAGDHSTALRWLDEGLAQYPRNPHLLTWKGITLIELRNYSLARESFQRVTNLPEIEPALRSMTQNNLAYVDVLLGDANLLSEADQYSQEAMANLGWVPAIKGTRGAVLLELGKIEEAITLLHDSMQNADNASSKAQNACFIAIAEARRGNLEKSRKYLDEARNLKQDCFLIERARTALKSLSLIPPTCEPLKPCASLITNEFKPEL